MAVVQMQQISVCAMKRDRKAILELLQQRYMVEVEAVHFEGEVFEHVDTANARNSFRQSAVIVQEAVQILNRYSGYKSSPLAFLNGRKNIEKRESDAFYERIEFVLGEARNILRLEREISESKAEISKMEMTIESLKPWSLLPIPPSFSSTKKCAVFVGSIPGEYEAEGILSKTAEGVPESDSIHVEVVYTDKRQTCFYLICLKETASEAERVLRDMGFTKPAITGFKKPADEIRSLEESCLEAETRINHSSEEIKTCEDLRQEFLLLEDLLNMRAEKYEAIERLSQSRHAFVLKGYVPKEQEEELKKELHSRFDCEAWTQTPTAEENVPVMLKNSSFTEPAETVLSSYGLPGKQDIDPTAAMSIFYYITFGLMFSDAGYGLLLAGACGFCLWKFKNMEHSWKKNLRLFFWCGVSTIFWGIVFSSYFGDVVNVVSRTFFGKEVGIPALWFMPLEEPMKLLVFCLAIGVVHLTVGYVLKGVTCIKNGDFLGVIYDGLFPLTVLYPLLLILMGNQLFFDIAGFSISLPEWAGTAALSISAVSAVGIVLTGGRESKSWGKRLLKGIYAIYNVLAGWLSDILSYSRLLALGLATGVIASVMNQLGSMFGKGIIGVIVFLLVFLVGQILNFAINVLGAYVHSNRLEFVEFFGKFYEGGGREFKPLGMHTKHYKITEKEIQK